MTKDLNCTITFYLTYYVFQYLSLGIMIDSAEKQNGQYYLSSVIPLLTHKSFNPISLYTISHYDVLLWYKWLGHPSFNYLKALYPKLFIKKDHTFVQCEHCVYAKHPHSHHPIHPYKSSQSFYIIHSDTWGPACVSTLISTRWFITFIDDHTHVCWV